LVPGWRTALTVCQAISIAMTVVLPAPVASFSATRSSSGFASLLAPRICVQILAPAAARSEATSASQIAVSTASIWQKKGLRLSN
jgi:hypothetical protein